MRVIEGGENLSFFAEAAQDEVSVHPAFDEFDGGAFIELVIGAQGFVDCAHAAASDLSFDSIRPEPASEQGIFFFDERFEDRAARFP